MANDFSRQLIEIAQTSFNAKNPDAGMLKSIITALSDFDSQDLICLNIILQDKNGKTLIGQIAEDISE